MDHYKELDKYYFEKHRKPKIKAIKWDDADEAEIPFGTYKLWNYENGSIELELVPDGFYCHGTEQEVKDRVQKIFEQNIMDCFEDE